VDGRGRGICRPGHSDVQCGVSPRSGWNVSCDMSFYVCLLKFLVPDFRWDSNLTLPLKHSYISDTHSTLRAYLSDKLHCDPMRITKKFTGSSCIGKRVFHPAVRCAENAAAIDSAQEELVSLEKRWRKRLKLKRGSSRNRSAKRESKPSSAAAVSVPPPTSADNSAPGHHSASTKSGVVSPPSVSPPSEQWSADDSSSAQYHPQPASGATSNDSSPPVPSAAVQHSGASWIERAQALLGGESTTNNGPSSENSYSRRKVSDTTSHTSHEGKEPQTASSSNISATVTPSEAKDAEALVGFLNSVRAEAASGNTGGL